MNRQMYLSYEAYNALLEAKRIAIKYGETHLKAEDLVIAILSKPKSSINKILEKLGDLEIVLKKAKARKGQILKVSQRPLLKDLKVAHRLKDVLEHVKSETSDSGRNTIEVEDFIMAILKNGDGIGADALISTGITVKCLKVELQLRSPKPRQPILLEKPIWDL